MRIVHVIDDLSESAGGPAQACVEMAAAVAAKGHQVSIYASCGRTPAWFPQSGPFPRTVRRDNVDVHLFAGRKQWCFGTSPGLYAALTRAIPDADVVHAHVLYGFHLWAAWQICRRHRVPLIVRPCGILNPYASSLRHAGMRLCELAFQSRLLREAPLIHYTTAQEADDAAPYTGNPRRAVISLGVNLAPYEDLPPRAEFDAHYPQARGRKTVLYFGRLHRKKRIDLVIGAVASLVHEGVDVHLIIAGSDDGVEAQCRALVREQGLSERTTFTGLLVGQAKRIAFGGADVFVLPSMTENFGIAVAEAAAAGIPLLISAHVNIAPVFACEQAAVVVTPELGAVAAGLRSILDRPDRASAMALRAKQVVQRTFAWDAVSNDLVSMYRTVALSPEEACGGKYLTLTGTYSFRPEGLETMLRCFGTIPNRAGTLRQTSRSRQLGGVHAGRSLRPDHFNDIT